MPTLPSGATGYTAPGGIAIDPDSEQLVRDAWGVLRAALGGPALPMYSLAGVQILGVRTGKRTAVFPSFLMGVTDGVLDFGGGVALPVSSVEGGRSVAQVVAQVDRGNEIARAAEAAAAELESRVITAEGLLQSVQTGPVATGSIVLDVDGVPYFAPGQLDPNLPPPPPREAVAAAAGSTAVRVSWQAPIRVAGVSDYRVRFRQPGGAWAEFLHTPSTVLSRTVTGLTTNVEYEFDVTSVGLAGSSEPVYAGLATPSLVAILEDQFNRADADTVGNSEVGASGQAVNYNGVTSTWGIRSNRLSLVASQPAGGFSSFWLYAPPEPFAVEWGPRSDTNMMYVFGFVSATKWLEWQVHTSNIIDQDGNLKGQRALPAGKVPRIYVDGDTFTFYGGLDQIGAPLVIAGFGAGRVGVRMPPAGTLDYIRFTNAA